MADAEDFWTFSLAFYGAAEVQAACLALQDDHGADVNVALYLMWRAQGGDWFASATVVALDDGVAPWRAAAVQPLRAVRRALKEAALLQDAEAQERLRTMLKKVELDSEKLEQRQLAALAPEADGRAAPEDALRRSLGAYAERLGTAFPDSLVATFAERLTTITQ